MAKPLATRERDAASRAARRLANKEAGLYTCMSLCVGCERRTKNVHLETHLCPPCLEAADLMTCECGRRKPLDQITSEACSHCTELDGLDVSFMAANLLSCLRVLGGAATMEALTDAMGVCSHTLWIGARELKALGRLETIVPVDQDNVLTFRYVSVESDDARKHHGKRGRSGYYVANKANPNAADYYSGPLLYILKSPRAA